MSQPSVSQHSCNQISSVPECDQAQVSRQMFPYYWYVLVRALVQLGQGVNGKKVGLSTRSSQFHVIGNLYLRISILCRH